MYLEWSELTINDKHTIAEMIGNGTPLGVIMAKFRICERDWPMLNHFAIAYWDVMAQSRLETYVALLNADESVDDKTLTKNKPRCSKELLKKAVDHLERTGEILDDYISVESTRLRIQAENRYHNDLEAEMPTIRDAVFEISRFKNCLKAISEPTLVLVDGLSEFVAVPTDCFTAVPPAECSVISGVGQKVVDGLIADERRKIGSRILALGKNAYDLEDLGYSKSIISDAEKIKNTRMLYGALIWQERYNTIKQLIVLGYTKKQLRAIGFTLKEIRDVENVIPKADL